MIINLNLPRRTVSWLCSEEGHLDSIVENHREEETSGGKQDRLQAQQLLDLASKHCLVQEVDRPTHSVEILDLVFTNNCELVNHIAMEDWPAFTDHKLVVVSTSFQLSPSNLDPVQHYLWRQAKYIPA